MKKLFLFFNLFLSLNLSSQTVIQFDNMETSSPTYLAAGWFIPAATAGWFNNASVSPTLSAVLYGAGNGTSAIEQDWYVLPNVTGLNPARQYQLKFRLFALRNLLGPQYRTTQINLLQGLRLSHSFSNTRLR